MKDIDAQDHALIRAAQKTLQRAYRPVRHTVGAAVLGASGRIYTGVNVEACGYGPCAEPIAIGAAFTNAESQIVKVVAVCKHGDDYAVLSPCGNCRQLICDYAPGAMVLIIDRGKVQKTEARNLLPGYYASDFD